MDFRKWLYDPKWLRAVFFFCSNMISLVTADLTTSSGCWAMSPQLLNTDSPQEKRLIKLGPPSPL